MPGAQQGMATLAAMMFGLGLRTPRCYFLARFRQHSGLRLSGQVGAFRAHYTYLRAETGQPMPELEDSSARQLNQSHAQQGINHNDLSENNELVQSAERTPTTLGQPSRQKHVPIMLASSGDFASFGETVVIPSSEVSPSNQCSFIFFHGLGDSARGFAGQLPGRLQLPWMHYVLPTAKSMGGTRSWFVGSATSGHYDESINYAHHLIRSELARGIASTKLFVGGFSQGGCVAVQAATSFTDACLGGCVGLSTFANGSLKVVSTNRRLPTLICHGEADLAVPFASGKALAAALRAEHLPLEFRSYAGMKHSTCPREVADVARFLRLHRTLAGGWPELCRMRFRQLKALLEDAGVSTLGCAKQADLLEKANILLQ